jgi:molybdenum cofactor cytidylyltransferase
VTGGIVLAAGEARRFGSPKQLAVLDGRPLLQHALDAMLAAEGVDRTVLVLGAHAERVRASIDPGVAGAAEIVVCPGWQEGLSVSLRCGLGALSGATRVVVTLGDQPRITAGAIAAVVAAAGDDAPGARASYEGVPGHPVLLGAQLLARVGELRGDAGFRDVLAGTEVPTVEVGHLARPDDVDTPEELEAMRP